MSLVRRLRSGLELIFTFCWDTLLPILTIRPPYYGLHQSLSSSSFNSLVDSVEESQTSASPNTEDFSTSGEDKPIALSIAHGITTPPITQTVCDFLDAHASASPAALAAQDILDRQLTYADLQASSVRLARQLKDRGVGRGSRVCLVLERSLEHIVALFAVLRLGAAYIPLDGTIIPHSVLRNVVSDARPTVILVSKTHVARSGSVEGKWYCIEDLLEADEHMGPGTSFDDARPEDPAYIIFTSGTTGRPKGVVVSHSNVVNLVCQAPGNLGITLRTKVAQLLNVAFDMCAWEIFSCILNGGSLYLRGLRRADWMKVMKTVDVLICTPSILEPHDPEDYANVKVIATAGEPCTKALLERWGHRVKFFNCCGPTETTIVNTMDLYHPGSDVTIGRPTPNNSVYVLDEELRPLPRGEVGMMWAGGLGVSLGYLNLPELTKIKYRRDPFRADGGIMYSTGDLGRLRVDGKFDHLGRVDEQVKVQGFRVELDGVSAAMRSCAGITSACALLIDGELHGFYAPSSVSAAAVLEATMAIQPCYAVPSRYIALDALPLTGNGKVDKRRLHEIAQDPGTLCEIVHVG
ncbi:acetyl-CoA synthetase-like protein [Dichomitus squalens]|uniref:Acetyl-CoA synthetase-like protein n=1 Tax=Dichomitus squalens TaxID=114155 RepID=A0A4Q9MD63_9APHY|nr:acetyl-CoA synthetase-like protein [Dichomitus squalens]